MLHPVIEHPWDLTPRDAMALQQVLRERVITCDLKAEPQTVAGIDVGLKSGLARAAVVVFSLPKLEILEYAIDERPVAYPYVPGLLSFREIPAILGALAQLTIEPDLLMCDAQGYAHPRRLGLASHLGVILDHPSIGCAKSRLCGTYEEPARERDSHTWLVDDEEVIGAVVRTRTNVKPVFVSIGHRIRLQGAIQWVLRCAVRYRLPEPTRWAHRYASVLRERV